MRNIFKRLTGILLVFVLLVTMAPVTFAVPTSTKSREFTFNGKEYIVVPTETRVVDGKTYYGIVSRSTLSYTWGKALFRLTYLSENTAGATGVDIPVKVNLLDGRFGTSFDIQTLLTDKFGDFGDYIIPSNTEWVLNTQNNSKLYYTGSLGMPTRGVFTTLYKNDKFVCAEGDGSFVLGDVSFYSDYYYLNMAGGLDGKPNDANPKINSSNTEESGTVEGGTWVFMTYVSEDFFKNNTIDLNTCGNRFLIFLNDYFTKADIRGAGYTEEEAVYIGFPAGTATATGVTLDKEVLNVNVNTEGKVKAFVQPLYEVANENVTWSSANTSIATIDENGVVFGKKIGQTTVTATTVDGGFTATCTVNVTPGTDYFVAPNGDDRYPGTIEAPFATVQKAVDTMQLGDTVYLRQGTYEETVKFNKGGTKLAQLSLKAYNGEKAVITGTREITNWTVDKTVGNNTIYKAYVGQTFDENSMIFFNNNYVDYAKWPNNTGDNNPIRSSYHDKTHPGLNDNWLFPTWAFLDSATGKPAGESDYNTYYGTIYDADLPFAKDELIGATMITKPGQGWYMYSGSVTDSDVGSFYIKGTMQFHQYYLPTKGNQYYLYGAKCLLDYKNEWYSDDNGYLYIITPDGTNPNNATITANVRKDAIDFNGNDYINVDGIEFFAGEMRVENSDNLKLTGITNKYVAKGPSFTGNNNILANSAIQYTVSQALDVGGDNNKIINNLIEYSCSDGQVRAVFMSGSKNAVIAYNTIRFVGSTGLDLNNRGGALITHNEISYFSAVCRDNGGMYGGYIDGVNMEISYNWVHDGMSNSTAGIYPDNSSANIIIHHNVGWNIPWGLLINGPRASILSYNNTFEGKSHTYCLGVDFGENLWGINNLFTNASNLSGYNIYCQGGAYMDSGYYNSVVQESNSLKSDSILSSIKANNFYPSASTSALVDQGKVIKGINDDYVGNAPDIGAYEYGAEKWIPGHDFSDTTRVDNEYERTEYVPFMNHIQSGGFETSLEDYSWETTGIKGAYRQIVTNANYGDNEGVHMGNYGLRLGSAGSTSGKDGVTQTILTLKPNTRYILMAAGRINDSTGANPIEMSVTGAASSSVDKVTFNTYKWDEKSLTFDTGADAEVTVSFIKNATGYGYIDSVMLYESSDQSGLDDDSGTTEPEDHTATSPNYIKLANGAKLLYTGVTDGDYLNFILAQDLAGRYGAEGFVIANNQYYISSSWTVSSGTSVSDAAMSKLPETMVDYVQSRPYAINVAGGATEHVNTTLKASVPSHDTLEAHAEYIQPLIDDNEGFTAGGHLGAAVGICVAAVNDWHPFFHYGFPNGVSASDGNYFTGSVFAEFYVHKDFFKAVKLNTATVGKNVKDYLAANFIKSDLAPLGYTDSELTALGLTDGNPEVFEKIELVVEKTVNATNNTIGVEAIISNNTRTPIPSGTYVVVASYSGNILSDVKVATLEAAIPVNATSGAFTFTLAAKGDAEENTIKVMLWSAINYLKPLSEVVIK